MKSFIFTLILFINLCAYAQDILPTTCISPSKAFIESEAYYQKYKKEINALQKLPGYNTRAYTQSIHNAITKWDGGSFYRFEIGTAPGSDNINRGHLLRNTDRHTGGHSFEDLRRSALDLGTTFNIGDAFYFSLYDYNGNNPSWVSPPLRFNWEDLGDPSNNLRIQVETNYGVNGLGPYAIWQRDKMMAFYNLVNPIIKEVFGAPSRNHSVYIVNDGNAVGTNTFYNGPNQISSTYLERNGDLSQPRLMIHELIHAYRDNVVLSSNDSWHYDPTLSGFEEGMAEAVAVIIMDIFIGRYPNFFNADEFKIHWSHSRGMPFDWDYDFKNHSQLTTTDFFSSDIGTGAHWERYGTSQAAMQKMYVEDPNIFKKFNAEYYKRLNANHELIPSRELIIDIFNSIIQEIERTPTTEWINDQRIFDCEVIPGDKVHMLTFHTVDPPRIHTLDNRVHIYQTQDLPGGDEWSWDTPDAANPANSKRWYVQTNNINGQLQIFNYDNSLHQAINIRNDKNSRRNGVAPYLGPYQGGNFMNYNGAFTGNDGRYDCIQPGCGKRPIGIESHYFYATSTTDRNHNDLPYNLPDRGSQLVSGLDDLGLYRYNISFEGSKYNGTYYRLHGQELVGKDGIIGGIKSNDITKNITGKLYIEHQDFGEENLININNGTFISSRDWAAVPETVTHRQGGRTDRRYSIPGKVHTIYISEDCSEQKIDFRNIRYGDGLAGSQLFLFTVEDFDIIEYTANDITICEGEDLVLTVENNFPDILDEDSRITYRWLNPDGIEIASSPIHTIPNASETTHQGTYTLLINSFGCIITQQVEVIINNVAFDVIIPQEITLCESETLTIEANIINDATYLWSGPNNFSSTTRIISIPNVTINNQGTYSLAVTALDCSETPITKTETTEVIINTDTDFEVNIPTLITLCEQQELTIEANLVNGATYLWSGPNNFSATTRIINIPNITQNQQGDYTVDITALNCLNQPITKSDTTTVEVNIDTDFDVNIPTLITLCEQQELTIEANLVNGATYLWSGPNNFSATTRIINIPSITQNQQGDYTVAITVLNCLNQPITKSDTTTVEVNIDTDFEVGTPSTTTLCEGQELILEANSINNATYLWSGPNNFSATTRIISIPEITTNQQGNYNIEVTVPNCIGNSITKSNTTIVDVNTDTDFEVNTPLLITLCEHEELIIEANLVIGATYQWTGPNNFSATTRIISIPNVTQNQQGSYNVEVTVPGCLNQPITKTSTTNVEIDADITLEVNTPPSIILCEGDDLTLEANVIEGATYLWNGPNNFSATTRIINIPNVSAIHQGIYLVEARIFSCTGDIVVDYSSTNVIINEQITIELITNDINVCEDETATLTVNEIDNATYLWTGPNNFSASTREVIIDNITLEQQGTYTVTVQAPDCNQIMIENSSDLVINIEAIPEIDLSDIIDEATVCYQNAFTLEVPSYANATYIWEGPGNYTSNERNLVLSNFSEEQEGLYMLTIMIPYCNTFLEEIHHIEITACPREDLIPDFFTPNGDGYNDIWSVNPNLVSFTNIDIYDRYGKLLKRLNSGNHSWDGVYNGANMPSSEYWYTIHYENNEVQNGHFSLIR